MTYPKLFNVEVYSVVCHCLSLTVEDNSAMHDGLGMVVGSFMGVFYSDDSMIISRDPEWLQAAINVIIGLFRRIILMANAG